MTGPPLIRARREDDLAALVEILGRQQPVSRYPMRWPLPYPTERFISRTGELGAWVAELLHGLLGRDGLFGALLFLGLVFADLRLGFRQRGGDELAVLVAATKARHGPGKRLYVDLDGAVVVAIRVNELLEDAFAQKLR